MDSSIVNSAAIKNNQGLKKQAAAILINFIVNSVQ